MSYSGGGLAVAHLALDNSALVRTATLVAESFYSDSASRVRTSGPSIDSLAAGAWILLPLDSPNWSDPVDGVREEGALL
jgi:hypothetical protein